MRAKTIRWIILLMSLSLIGIIAFQYYWISSMVDQKQAELDQHIDRALSNLEESIEEGEARTFIKKGLRLTSEDSVLHFEDGKQFRFLSEVRLEDSFNVEGNFDKDFELIADKDAKTEIVFEDDESRVNIYRIRDSSEAVEKVELVKRFNERRHVLNEAVQRIAIEFAFEERSFANRINELNIDSLLKMSFEKEGLNDLPHAYSIRAFKNDSLIKSSKEEIPNELVPSYERELLREEGSENNGMIKIFLIGSKFYLFKNLWPILLGTLLLTLVMLFTFSFTIYSIYRQKKLSKMKSDFINNMTHEFKTPIATISLALDSIFHPNSRSGKAEVERFGGIIRKENERMHRQVEHLLQAAQFEKGEIELNLQALSLHQLIAELLEQTIESRPDHQLKIDLELEAQNDLIKGDQMHLFNALRNLIDNAIKFSEQNAEILIKTINQADKVLISIEDKGIGMSNETQSHIFDRFYRYTEGDLHQTKGFGLGLSYVKDVIEQIDGKIWVDSKVGKGSSFHIEIKNLDNG